MARVLKTAVGVRAAGKVTGATAVGGCAGGGVKAKRVATVRLSGLPGVRRQNVRAVSASSVRAILEALRTHRAATAAGSCGAINVWLDDCRSYRAEFQRCMVTVGRISTKNREHLRDWLHAWLPKLENA